MSLLFYLFLFFKFCFCDILPNDYWGTAYVTKQGIEQLFEVKGYANHRWNIPHTASSRFPIGSNTKLFTAVGIYQLHERGLLNVHDSVTTYLDQTDFQKMGLNITKWCPVIYGDTTNTCQNITFVQLLSMSSGLLPNYACKEMYNDTNPLYKYCWDFCTFTFQPYQGTLAYYIKSIIESPMVFKPGTQYQYCNMNFMLAAYIIEKLTQTSFDLYLNTNVIQKMGLKNTYCDLWDGQLSDNQNRVDEYFLIQNENDPLQSLGVGWCHPYVSMGMSSGSGCVIGNNYDMNTWYTKLFNHTTGYIPDVFMYENTRDLLIGRYTLTSNNNGTKQYYAQGVYVEYDNDNDIWPSLIYYAGATFCSHTAMKMVPDNYNTMLVISAFNNAPHMLVEGGQPGLEKLKYDTPYGICQMVYEQGLVKGDNGLSYWIADELLKIYS